MKLIPAQSFGTTKYVLNAGNWYLLEKDFKVFDDRHTEIVGATWDSNRRIMTFASGLSIQRSYFVEAQFTNAYEALADLWEQKANQRFDYIDWKAQNNRMAMQQEYEHCLKQRDYYRNKIVRRFKRQKGKWTL